MRNIKIVKPVHTLCCTFHGFVIAEISEAVISIDLRATLHGLKNQKSRHKQMQIIDLSIITIKSLSKIGHSFSVWHIQLQTRAKQRQNVTQQNKVFFHSWAGLYKSIFESSNYKDFVRIIWKIICREAQPGCLSRERTFVEKYTNDWINK